MEIDTKKVQHITPPNTLVSVCVKQTGCKVLISELNICWCKFSLRLDRDRLAVYPVSSLCAKLS